MTIYRSVTRCDQIFNFNLQLVGTRRSEVKVGPELGFHLLEDGVLGGPGGAPHQALAGRAPAAAASGVGAACAATAAAARDVLDADAEGGDELLHEVECVRRDGGVLGGYSVMSCDITAAISTIDHTSNLNLNLC